MSAKGPLPSHPGVWIIKAARIGDLPNVKSAYRELLSLPEIEIKYYLREALLWSAALGSEEVILFLIVNNQSNFLSSQDFFDALKKAFIYNNHATQPSLLAHMHYQLEGIFSCTVSDSLCDKVAILKSTAQDTQARQDSVKVFIPNFQKLGKEESLPPRAGFFVGEVFCPYLKQQRKL